MTRPSLNLDHDLPIEERIRAYEEDRDELLLELRSLHPRAKNKRPADLVEGVITDVCSYFIDERALPKGQLALCDAGANRVLWNSSAVDFLDPRKVDFASLRSSTMAHELGHVRLHHDELVQKACISFQDEGRFFDTRAFQKEREADLYASVFLVPQEMLQQEPSFHFLERAREEKRTLKSGQIWYRVYQLCERFGVTPTLMSRSLEIYGWIAKKPAKRQGFNELELL